MPDQCVNSPVCQPDKCKVLVFNTELSRIWFKDEKKQNRQLEETWYQQRDFFSCLQYFFKFTLALISFNEAAFNWLKNVVF